MEEMAFKWPEWIGSPSQAGIFILVLIAFLRWSLPWRKMSLDEGKQIRQELREQITSVRDEHKVCENNLADARKEIRVLRDEVNDLETRIHGLRRQHIQEQISTISSIINAVGDNPQLTTLLKTFETVQRTLPELKGADDERA